MRDDELLLQQLEALAEGEGHWLALLANASALLFDTLPGLNWAGFYLLDGDSLLLGPFQGKVACVRIPWGKGVCGTAAAADKSLRVSNVHEFPGHIACDSASNAELVIPLHRDGRVCGVLDLDSPELSRFSERDEALLERFVRVLECRIDWRGL